MLEVELGEGGREGSGGGGGGGGGMGMGCDYYVVFLKSPFLQMPHCTYDRSLAIICQPVEYRCYS